MAGTSEPTDPMEPTPAAGAGGTPPAAPAPSDKFYMPWQSEGWRAVGLDTYLEANWDRFTPEALAGALRAAGHTDAVVGQAIERVGARRAADIDPVRARARRIARIVYFATYVVYMAGLLLPKYDYGLGVIGAVVLTVVMLVVWVIADGWIRRRNASSEVTGLLIVPLVLLVVVGGLCTMTTGSPGLLLWPRTY